MYVNNVFFLQATDFHKHIRGVFYSVLMSFLIKKNRLLNATNLQFNIIHMRN